MRISFDVDGTLIPVDRSSPADPERVPFFLRWWLRERVREGTTDLMRQLSAEGWEIAIYTTSFRSPLYLKWLFRWYGARVVSVVNADLHAREIGRVPSKFPSRFGIHLHVDDSDGLRLEGEQYGFDVVVVRPEDEDWTGVVLARARDQRSHSPAMTFSPPKIATASGTIRPSIIFGNDAHIGKHGPRACTRYGCGEPSLTR